MSFLLYCTLFYWIYIVFYCTAFTCTFRLILWFRLIIFVLMNGILFTDWIIGFVHQGRQPWFETWGHWGLQEKKSWEKGMNVDICKEVVPCMLCCICHLVRVFSGGFVCAVMVVIVVLDFLRIWLFVHVVYCCNFCGMHYLPMSQKIIYNSVIIDTYFSSFRDNWQDMITEEIKSLFRKANRQVDKPKIWEAPRMLKMTKKEIHMTSCMG